MSLWGDLRLILSKLDEIERNQKAMSDTIANELTVINTALGNLKTAVDASVANTADLAAKLAAAAAGGATPEQLTQMAADAQAINDAATALQAALPAPAAAPAAPAPATPPPAA